MLLARFRNIQPILVLPALTIPLAARVIGWVLNAQDRDAFHRSLKGTSALHMAFGLLLAVGLYLDGSLLSH